MSNLSDRLREDADLGGPPLAPLMREAADELDRLRRIHNDMHLSEGGWIYQGDDSDHLESLTCQVVIQPEQLRELVDCEKGMQALRHVCQKHSGVSVDKQSSSSEDIALWADSMIASLGRLACGEFDTEILRHWGLKFLETKRETT